jgi:hypothetical protein
MEDLARADCAFVNAIAVQRDTVRSVGTLGDGV